MSTRTFKWLGLAAITLLILGGLATVSAYNRLVTLEQAVDAQWAQVENTYQRRLDLIPNLVATVKGAAAFEKDTLIAVTEARSKVGQVTMPDPAANPAAFEKFQEAQDQLSGALSRLMVVAEKYPELTATQNFRDLQAQLEGTENRITVERMRFNEAARAFNTERKSFPTNVLVGIMGDRFQERSYFKATAAAAEAPVVVF